MLFFLLLTAITVTAADVNDCWSGSVVNSTDPRYVQTCQTGTAQCYKVTVYGNGRSASSYGCDTVQYCNGISNNHCKTIDRGGGVKQNTCCCGSDFCNGSSIQEPLIFSLIFSLIIFKYTY